MCTSILINQFNLSTSSRNPQLSGVVGPSLSHKGISVPQGAPWNNVIWCLHRLSVSSPPSALGTGCSLAGKVVFRNTSGSAGLSPGSSLGQLFLSLSDGPLSFPTGRSGSLGINLHSLQVHIICWKMPILGEQPQKGGIYYTITLGEVSATLILL